MRLTKADMINIALALLVPFGAYFGYFKQRTVELRRLDEETAALDRKAADESKTTTRVLVARKNLRKFRQRISEFMECITPEDEAHRAVGAIVGNAREAGLNIEQIKPGSPVEGKTLSYLPINLTAAAEFPKFYEFLRRVEQHKTVMTVNMMAIESKPGSERCTVKLELRIYFVKSPPAPRQGTQT